MPLPRLATDSQLDRVLDAALSALGTVGFLVQDAQLKDSLLAAGCTEGTQSQVLIPRGLVDEMLTPRLVAPEVAPDGPPRLTDDPGVGIGSQLAQFYLDPETQRRLPGSRELLAEIARFGHVWQPETGVGPALLCRDVPPPVEPLEAVLTIAECTDHVGSAYVHQAEQVPYLAEVGEILHGDGREFLSMCLFTVTPLRLDRRAGALLRELLARGVRVWVGTQPAAGVSAPVTPAGAVVLGAAEILAGWVAAFVLDPTVMPGAGICSGVLDMKTADVSFCAPEAMLQDLLCVELFRERLGGRCHVAGQAGYTDAKWPGSQRAFEAAFEALTVYAYAGSSPGTGSGLLESGKTFSPVQFMLDHEFARYLGRFARGVSLDDEDIALEAILEIGLGLTRNHLTSEHTLARFRALYQPTLLDRSFWHSDADTAASEERLLAAAWREYQAVRERYKPASVGEEKLHALRGVLDRAWQGLGSAPRP